MADCSAGFTQSVGKKKKYNARIKISWLHFKGVRDDGMKINWNTESRKKWKEKAERFFFHIHIIITTGD